MISIKIGDNYIFFDRSKVIEKIENKQKVDYTKALDKVEDDKDLIVLGYNDEDKELLVMNKKEFNVFSTYLNGNKKNDIGSNLYSTITNLISEFDEDIDAKVNSKNAGNRFVYSRVRTGNVKVPTILLLGFYEGLENVLDRYDIDYEFTEDKKNLPPKEDSKYNMVEFADGYLYYSNEPFRNSMLLNGLYEPPTKEVEFDKLNEKTIYLDFFQDLYGSRLKGKTFNNIMDLFIDPITEDVLEDLDQPTDIVGVLLYANELLTNNAYKDKNSMENYRLRGAEQVNAILYKSMADAFRKYKDARRGGNTDVNISVKKDEVVKSILDQPNVNEYSILNPFIEVQSMGASSYSGPSGQNLSRSFTLEQKAYDESMFGTFSINTPDSGKVGNVRQMSYNASIENTRGIIDTSKSVEDLTAADILAPSEMFNSFTATRSDAQRIQMTSIQSKHIINTDKQDKLLVGSGVEKTMPQVLNDDFVFKAKDSGKVEKIDEENQLMIVKYDNGEKDLIDLSPVLGKNSNSGLI
jgi:hypothetical protein